MMSFRDPARLVVHVALSSLVLVAVACSDDVEVGGFGGGGGSPTTGPGGEAGAASTTTTASDGSGSTTASTGSGDGGAGGEGTTGQGGEAGATGQGGSGQGGGEPALCGGLAEGGPPTCDDDTWCDYPDDSFCGGDDSTGLCLPRPLDCSEDGPIACGCDGEAYTNACYAQVAGTDVSTDEPTCGAPCGGLAGDVCPEDQFCQFAQDTCGLSDEQGTCVKRPTVESCSTFADAFAPICACDGVTYENACEAAAAGADVWGGEDLCDA